MADLAKELLKTVDELLENGRFTEAVQTFQNEKYVECLKNHSWDLIPKLCQDIAEKKNLDSVWVRCCEELLEILALKANTEEVLLEFIEQGELAEDHSKFIMILKLLDIVLSRPIAKRTKSVEWCFGLTQTYLQKLETCYETSENLEDLDLLKAVVDFYMKFTSEVFDGKCEDKDEMQILLASNLVQILSYVFPFLPNRHELEKSVMNLIIQLLPHPFTLIMHLDNRNVNKTLNIQCLNEVDADIVPCSAFENKNLVSDLALAMFFFNLVSSDTDRHTLCPYDKKFAFITISALVVCMTEQTNQSLVHRGLLFLDLLLAFDETLAIEHLYFDFHKPLLKCLNQIMVYSEIEDDRNLSLKCFKSYIARFGWKARFWLLVNLRDSVDHSGSLGLIITMIKDLVVESFKTPCDLQLQHFFSGKLLFDLISSYCLLTQDVKTDIVNDSDQIISSINLLTLIVLSDKNCKYKVFVSQIHEKLIKLLKELVRISKQSHQVKLKEITDQGCELKTSEFNVTVKNQVLPPMSVQEQTSIMYCMINTVDLIDSLLSRLVEFLDNKYSIY